MRAVFVAAAMCAVLGLAACEDTHQAGGHSVPQPMATSATMPPNRTAACAESALVDDKCTKQWYSCSAQRSVCGRQWEDCCRATYNTN